VLAKLTYPIMYYLIAFTVLPPSTILPKTEEGRDIQSLSPKSPLLDVKQRGMKPVCYRSVYARLQNKSTEVITDNPEGVSP